MSSELEKLKRQLKHSEEERLILDSIRIEHKKLRIKLKNANDTIDKLEKYIENVNKLHNENQAPT